MLFLETRRRAPAPREVLEEALATPQGATLNSVHEERTLRPPDRIRDGVLRISGMPVRVR